MIICPKCKKKLEKNEKTYKCELNHSFDIAKTSHINLLMSSKNGEQIGDNKEMVTARTEFLAKDYYKKLATKVAEKIPKNAKKILDAGCGQGYYTKYISSEHQKAEVLATDISKHAVMHGAKNDKNSLYFVSSVYDLPVQSESIDVVVTIFAPLALEEFSRVLAKDGVCICVVAGENHLYELKSEVYEKPYKNDENKYEFDGFEVISKEKLTYKTVISENMDIKHLFWMTPYAFKTSIEDTKKLDKLQNLEVTLDFAIYIVAKKIKIS